MRRNNTQPRLRTSRLDEETRELIERARSDDGPEESADSRRSTQVTPNMCALMRYATEEYDTKVAIAEEFGVDEDTAIYHLNQKCKCATRNHVHYGDCTRMRNRAHRGVSAGLIALFHGVEVDTVWTHIGGRCDHDDGYEPVPTARGPDTYTEQAADAD